MASSAQTHREVLAKHGLAQSVLDEFVQMLDQFDAAVALGNDGKTAHVGATRELRAVASEIVRTVRVMDGRNRQRFAEDGQLLGSWISASTVLGTLRPGTEAEGGAPAGGEVRPAASGAPGQVGSMPRAIEARGWKREPPPIVATVGGSFRRQFIEELADTALRRSYLPPQFA